MKILNFSVQPKFSLAFHRIKKSNLQYMQTKKIWTLDEIEVVLSPINAAYYLEKQPWN